MASKGEKKSGTDTYRDFIRRGLAAYGRTAREDAADPSLLEQLVAIRAQLDAAQEEVVAALRAEGFSWAEIGAAPSSRCSHSSAGRSSAAADGAATGGGGPSTAPQGLLVWPEVWPV